MEDHKAALAEKVEERTAELAETNKKLAKMNDHIQDLKDTVQNQEMSLDDWKKMEAEQKALQASLDEALELRESRRAELSSLEEELVHVTQHVDRAIATYNQTIMDLPVSEATEFQCDRATLNKSQRAESVAAMIGTDLSNTVRPKISQRLQNQRKNADMAQSSHQDALDQLGRAEEGVTDVTAKLQIVRAKIAQCEQTLDQEREIQEAKIAVRQREVDAMEAKINGLSDPVALEAQMAQFERQCAELEALRRQHEEESVAKKRAVVQEIQEALALMAEHDAHFEKKQQELAAYWDRKKASVEGDLVANI